jgi:hypothetical protein
MYRSPAELLAVVPYTLGFHPSDSLVVAAVRDRGLLFAARHDLPEDAADDGDADHLATVVARQNVDGVVLIGYGEPRRVTPTVLRTSEAMGRRGVTVVDELRVTDGRWWSYRCTDPSCCPPGGLPCLPADSVVAAEATYAGEVALPDRAALVAQVAAVTGAERAAMTAALGRARQRLAELGGAVRRAGRSAVREAERRYRSGGRLTDDEMALLGVLLTDRGVRDYAWERLGPQEWRLPLWIDAARRLDPALVALPAAMLAFTAWQCGRGALARVAVDRALAEAPADRMSRLLDQILTHGLPPWVRP